MTTLLRDFWQSLMGQSGSATLVTAPPTPDRPLGATTVELDIAPNDPLVAYFQSIPGTVEVDRINLDSSMLRKLQAAGVKLVVPLVSQGELIGLLNLGPRLSEQDYSTDDRVLLHNLAAQAAPAVRVAQLVRQQQAEAQERERMEQELRVARLIQQTLLPKSLPELLGWHVAAYYQPARAVGGDFYDFIYLEDGRLGLVIGDVTDKGVPAALVMATTRSILRGAAQRLASPGQVLAHTNDMLCPDIPRNMFVTCLYAILDPDSGRLHYANAGHDVPYRRHAGGVAELRATGMPLGLMPGMYYEERETTLGAGESILFYSDGLVEAHNSRREMFGFPHLRTLIQQHSGGAALIDFLLEQLMAFVGPNWEQEDDTTLVTLQRSLAVGATLPLSHEDRALKADRWRTLAEFSLPSEPNNERLAMNRVAEAVRELGLPVARLERLKTAVAEATMNAIEHGNKNRPEVPVDIRVLITPAHTALAIHISDHGGGRAVPEPTVPDLEAKLTGQQTPRGWGLFLIQNMVDEMNVVSDDVHHTMELILRLKGDEHVNPSA